MIKKLTFTILLAVTAIISFAQQNKIPFEKYGVADGLPEEVAADQVQDDKGFIWIATQNGLVKYDGYHFKVYKATLDKTDSVGLQTRNLGGKLLKTRDGKIWMTGDNERGAVTAFDPVTEKFRNFYLYSKNDKNLGENDNHLLFEDEAGNIWFKNLSVITKKYITCRLNPSTGEINRYNLIDILKSNFFLRRSYGTVESTHSIWLLDDKYNLTQWNRRKDSFEIIIPAGQAISSSAKADTIKQITKLAGSHLILSGTQGFYVFDAENKTIVKSYIHSAGNTNSIADSIIVAFEDVKGQFWVIHKHGIISLIDPATDNVQIFTYGSGVLSYDKGPKEIRGYFVGTQNKEGIWFQGVGNDFRVKFFIHYNFVKKSFSFYDNNFNVRDNPLPLSWPYNFFEDRTGLLWLGTRPGLYKQAPKKKQMDLFRYHADEPNGLPSDSIQYLFEDSKKRLWVGTANGLALYQPGQDNFKIFRNDPKNATSLCNSSITTVQEDADGKIWIGTDNGLNQWQESTGNFKRFFYNPAEINRCRFLFNDKQQRLWLSISNKGVFVLDNNTGSVLKSFIRDDKNPASLTSKNVGIFYQDSRGTIWLGDRGDNDFGLYKLNEAENGFTHYMPIPGDSSSISSNEISFVAEDGKKHLWVGTDGGLNLYDYEHNKFARFKNSSLSSVNYFVTDKKGDPWFGTYSSGGLVSVDAEKRIITTYDETKGLLQNDVNAGHNSIITKDDFGRFWLATQRGLSVFDPEHKSFVSYFEKDGFQPYDRYYQTIKTSNGDIWIGSNNGLNHIVPANLLKKDTTTPSIVITQMSINDSLYSQPDGNIFKQSVAYTNAIELKYWQKNLSFDFVALHYLRSEDNLYSWKLENYDKNWSAPSKERKASYTNLSPGKYIFRVKASNADGVWNEEGISITIRILPPWWMTWWAYTIYALLFLAALRMFSLWRERRLRQEKEVLQEKVEERTVELRKKSEELTHSLEDLKSTQSQLIQSEKMASLGELTAGIAHEIQNPLNFVNNFSEVNKELLVEMKDEIKKGNIDEVNALADDVIANEEKINHHGKRADAIVKGMLQHSRSSSGVKEPTDINALCDEYLRLSYHGLRAKDKSFNATMKTDFDESIGNINIIPQDIGRVILNLITNAFYVVDEKKKQAAAGLPTFERLATLYDPTIFVSTKKVGDKVLISVKDNGNGIPQKILDKIFQPFFTTKPTGQGTGLGLSLSYDIVKAHGGELKVETKENEGTEFIIQLPI